jgi:hypothetical protein
MYCTSCGAQVQADQRMCSVCGRPLTPGFTAASPSGRVTGHVRTLAICWIALSAIHLVRGTGRLFGARLVRLMGYSWFNDVPWGWPASGFLSSVLSFVGMVSLAMAIAGFIAGFGLLERRPWARTLAIVLGIISLLNPLLGTVLGIYTLWVLLPAQAEEEYRRIARPA